MTSTVSFFCRNCDLDQDLLALKQSNRWVEWWHAVCTACCGAVMRYITNPKVDPYFVYSQEVRSNSDKYRKDLIQPGKKGFNTLYQKQAMELETQREDRERKHKENIKSRDAFYKKHNYNIHEKEKVKAAIEVVEKPFWDNVK